MTRTAILYALAAMGGWGVWSVLAKLATRSLPPALAMVISYATGAAIALGYVFVDRGSITLPAGGVAMAAAAGVFAGVGAVSFYVGLSQGRASVVTTISALYFVVAALIGVVALDESLTASNLVGIGLAVVAVALLAR